MGIERRGPKHTSPTENPVSLVHGKYDDIRMPWVGRDQGGDRSPTITDTSAKIMGVNENRVYAIIENVGSNPCWLNFGEAAVVDNNGSLMLLPGGSSYEIDRLHPWSDFVCAICDTGLTTTLLIHEVSQPVEMGRGD